MDELDDLLTASAPRVAPSAELARVTNRVTARRGRRALIVAGIVALSLGGATAAAAGTGTLDEIIDYYLSPDGQLHNDHAWEMDITGADGIFHCRGGIVVMPADSKADFIEEDYLAVKKFVQNHDWSDLRPNPALLHERDRGTAEQLAITADRNMTTTAEKAGLSLSSVEVRGYAECLPK